MLPAMMETLQHEMKLGGLVEGVRCALTPEQVYEYELPRSLDAMKDGDSRTPKFREMLRSRGYPDDLAVELDALPPDTLSDLVRSAIVKHLDMSAFEAELDRETTEEQEIDELRERIARLIEDER